MSRSRGATSQKAGFNPSFIYGEFAINKNQAERSSHPARVGLAPGATAEEFSVVRRDALFESDFGEVIKQLSEMGNRL